MTINNEWVSESAAYLTPPPAGGTDPWTEQTRIRGRAGGQRIVDVREEEAPESVRDALDLADGDVAVVRERLVELDGVPVEIARSYYPISVARGTPLASRARIKGGATRALADLGYTPAEAIEEVAGRPASDSERVALGLPKGAWVMIMERVVRNADGRPFEFSEMVMRPEGRRLRYAIKVTNRGD